MYPILLVVGGDTLAANICSFIIFHIVFTKAKTTKYQHRPCFIGKGGDVLMNLLAAIQRGGSKYLAAI